MTTFARLAPLLQAASYLQPHARMSSRATCLDPGDIFYININIIVICSKTCIQPSRKNPYVKHSLGAAPALASKRHMGDTMNYGGICAEIAGMRDAPRKMCHSGRCMRVGMRSLRVDHERLEVATRRERATRCQFGVLNTLLSWIETKPYTSTHRHTWDRAVIADAPPRDLSYISSQGDIREARTPQLSQR